MPVQQPLPSQPAGVPWPTKEWPTGPAPSAAARGLRRRGCSRNHLSSVSRSRSSSSTAAASWPRATGPDTDDDHDADLVVDGQERHPRPGRVSSWATVAWPSTIRRRCPSGGPPDDPRHPITVQQLLEMRSGLRFAEDYVDAGVSDVIEMLFGRGQHDVAAFAAGFPLDHPPGTVWSYSSGTTNIVSRVVGDAVGGGEAGMRRFLHERLFDPLGHGQRRPALRRRRHVHRLVVPLRHRPRLRPLRLPLPPRRRVGGRAPPARGLGRPRPHVRAGPAGRGASATAPTGGCGAEYPGAFAAHGYEGQYLIVVPDRDLVVVRLGKTPVELRPALVAELHRLIEAVEP